MEMSSQPFQIGAFLILKHEDEVTIWEVTIWTAACIKTNKKNENISKNKKI